ncbi:hypothetical protein WKI68_16090 [Streptomyces sp. MS1.HAVA.3]|uniref:Uncharacterized protein n=1 Tax=Streptomyces caledonius TaxID=3134107 RepID=A0ABU8U3R1_9ACTN
MELTALKQSEVQVSAEDSRTMWELSVRAAALPAASTPQLADMLLDIPAGVRDPLLSFAEGTSHTGYLLLRGLEVGDLPPTPTGHDSHPLDGHGTSGTMALFADLVGSLIGYQDEKNGALIHDVHPCGARKPASRTAGRWPSTSTRKTCTTRCGPTSSACSACDRITMA